MNKLDKNRVFAQEKLKELGKNNVKLMNQAMKTSKETETELRKLKSILGRIPSEAKSFQLQTDIDRISGKLNKPEFTKTKTKTAKTLDKLMDQVPVQDKAFAKKQDAVKDDAKKVEKAAQDLRKLIAGGVTPGNYCEFARKIEDLKGSWKMDEVIKKDLMAATIQMMKHLNGKDPCNEYSVDPVNLSTGNYIYEKEELKIDGLLPLSFKRFYNALNDREGSLGNGWIHNYEVHLKKSEEESCILVKEDGAEDTFIRESETVYRNLENGLDVIRVMETREYVNDGEDSTGRYLYINQEGRQYIFHENGQMECQKDANGNSIRFYYDENNRLVKAETSCDAALFYQYQENGKLVCVKDHTDRMVSLEYLKGKLRRVTNPMGARLKYAYSAEGKISSVTDERGTVSLLNSYDKNHRVIKQKFPDGSEMRYEYLDDKKQVVLTERNGSRITYIHDEKHRSIRNIYENGEERFEYNEINQKTLEIDRLGNETRYSYDNKGNISGIINAAGIKTDIRYEEHNQPVYIAVDGKVKVQNHYDQNGNLTETKNALGNSYRISYNKQGQPEALFQPDGSKCEFFCDQRGNITQLKDAAGSTHCFVYDALNRIVETVDGNRNITKFGYDHEGNIIRVINANGDVREYRYNHSNKVTEIKDFDGSIVKREYNNLNLVSKVIDPLGRETHLRYDKMWNLSEVEQPNGAKTLFFYNSQNVLESIKNANGHIISYAYDANGNRTKTTDEDGNETFFIYDVLGRLIEVNGEEGARLKYFYDVDGNVVKVQDAQQNEVTFDYDANGNLIREKGPSAQMRSYCYTVMEKLESVTDEAGRKTNYVYTPGGRLQEIQYWDGTKESYTYDGNGNIESYTDQRGYTLSYTYDSLDRVIRIRGSEEEEKQYTYDGVGNVSSVTDYLGNLTKYSYSLTGQLVSVTDPLGNVTEYRYDECDRLIETRQYGEKFDGSAMKEQVDEDLARVQNLNGQKCICNVTRYERNLLGQVISVTDALGQRESYTYSPKGQLLSKVDQEGYLTKYGYTPHGDIKQVHYGDGREVRFSYNSLRHLQEMEDWLGITKIETDPMGRARKVIYPDGKEVSYILGAAGERRNITYPDGREVQYGYDRQLRLTEMKEGSRLITYEYEQSGLLSSKKYSNGTETSYTYNKKGQLRNLLHTDKSGIIDAYTYQYDPSGNKTGIEKIRRDLEEESGSYDYSYDVLGRLVETAKNGKTLRTYHYDEFGNRIRKNENGTVTTYTYNAINQLVNKVEGGTEENYQYDRRGNLMSVLENGNFKKQYLYGSLNRLEEVRGKNGRTTRYLYNGLGHRVGKRTGMLQPQTGQTKVSDNHLSEPLSFMRGHSFHLTGQVDDIIDLTKEYHNLLQRTEGNNTHTYLCDGNITGVIENGENLLYYLQDDMGSPVRLLDDLGEVREMNGYDEFGKALYSDQKSYQPFSYTGYQFDSVSDTLFAQAREYVPQLGRFISKDTHWHPGNMIYGDDSNNSIPDPLAIAQSNNSYRYALNSPLIYVDLNGRWITQAIGAGVGAIVGVGSQFVSDLVTSAFNGEFSLSGWETYTGAAVGGAAGGVLVGSGIIDPRIVGAVSGGASTAVTQGLEYASGKNRDRTLGDIAFNTAVDAGVGAAFGWLSGKIRIPGITSGSGNMDASFRMVLTKINKYGYSFTWKTLKNGIVSGFFSGGMEAVMGGILGSDLIENFVSSISGSQSKSWQDTLREFLKDLIFNQDEGCTCEGGEA